MASVVQESRTEALPWLPITGKDRLDRDDPRRPCGQHYRMLGFKARRGGIVSVSMSPCGRKPLLHPFLMLFYGRGMGGVRLADSDCTGDGGAAASVYVTGSELYTVVFTSYLPGEAGAFSFCIKEGR